VRRVQGLHEAVLDPACPVATIYDYNTAEKVDSIMKNVKQGHTWGSECWAAVDDYACEHQHICEDQCPRLSSCPCERKVRTPTLYPPDLCCVYGTFWRQFRQKCNSILAPAWRRRSALHATCLPDQVWRRPAEGHVAPGGRFPPTRSSRPGFSSFSCGCHALVRLLKCACVNAVI
jgi:hypothetical protein